MEETLLQSLTSICVQVLVEKLGVADAGLAADIAAKRANPEAYPEPANDVYASKCVCICCFC